MIPRSFACLNDASLFEADKVAFLADDDMIQKVNAQDLASLMQPLRHAFIFRAGFWIAGRVIVSHQDRGGITQDRRLKDLSKVANNVLQFSITIPRTKLRPQPGQRFLGAPLPCTPLPAPHGPTEEGRAADASKIQPRSHSGDPSHV